MPVPLGDYRGFLGGPAARKNADQTYAVWGVIVATSVWWNGAAPLGTLLRIEVLPRELKDDNLSWGALVRRGAGQRGNDKKAKRPLIW